MRKRDLMFGLGATLAAGCLAEEYFRRIREEERLEREYQRLRHELFDELDESDMFSRKTFSSGSDFSKRPSSGHTCTDPVRTEKKNDEKVSAFYTTSGDESTPKFFQSGERWRVLRIDPSVDKLFRLQVPDTIDEIVLPYNIKVYPNTPVDGHTKLLLNRAIETMAAKYRGVKDDYFGSRPYASLADFLPLLTKVDGKKLCFLNYDSDDDAELLDIILHALAYELIFCDMEYPELNLEHYEQILENRHIKWEGKTVLNADASKLDAQGVMALLYGMMKDHPYDCIAGLYKCLDKGILQKWLLRLRELDEEAEKAKTQKCSNCGNDENAEKTTEKTANALYIPADVAKLVRLKVLDSCEKIVLSGDETVVSPSAGVDEHTQKLLETAIKEREERLQKKADAKKKADEVKPDEAKPEGTKSEGTTKSEETMSEDAKSEGTKSDNMKSGASENTAAEKPITGGSTFFIPTYVTELKSLRLPDTCKKVVLLGDETVVNPKVGENEHTKLLLYEALEERRERLEKKATEAEKEAKTAKEPKAAEKDIQEELAGKNMEDIISKPEPVIQGVLDELKKEAAKGQVNPDSKTVEFRQPTSAASQKEKASKKRAAKSAKEKADETVKDAEEKKSE